MISFILKNKLQIIPYVIFPTIMLFAITLPIDFWLIAVIVVLYTIVFYFKTFAFLEKVDASWKTKAIILVVTPFLIGVISSAIIIIIFAITGFNLYYLLN